MRIIFIGDVYGQSGRRALETHLPQLKQTLKPDVTIVNVDNASHGHGITDKHADSIFALGADCLTGGDHIWDQRVIIPYIARQPKLLRPENFPAKTPGHGAYKVQTEGGQTCLVIHVFGRVFTKALDDPFAAVNKIVEVHKMNRDVDAIFVDFHAEATSEKMAMGHYLDGRVSAVIGTHTHIPTADYHIMVHGTAFQADAGMTGDFDSVIGARKDIPVQKFVKQMPGEKMIPSMGEATLCGCLVVTDDKTGLAKSISPIRMGGVLSPVLPQI